MLLDVAMDSVGLYLTPDQAKLASKGIASVKSRVTNLSTFVHGISHASWTQTLVAAFYKHHGLSAELVPPETLDSQQLLRSEPELRLLYDQLRSWDWRLGKTPYFTHQLRKRFAWGEMDVMLTCDKGRVENIDVFSDSLHPQMVQDTIDCLKGVEYSRAAVAQALEARCQRPLQEREDSNDLTRQHLAEFRQWIVQEI
jgi:lipoate-protein ligase A